MTRRRFPWIGATLLLAACSGGDLSDLEEYARQIKARPPTPIEPLPEIKPVDTFVFEPGNRRDPFVADKSGVEAPAANPGDSLAPDPLRRKEELEGY
jgi:type IV pilus assembly protein PilP